MRQLPVTVLSGFLGAGKTTLLNAVLRNQHGMRVAVIVNDMSEINVDGRLVADAVTHCEAKLVEFQNGCICCTLREDLIEAVGTLAHENRFDYLLIESTGISEPVPVAQSFTLDDPALSSLHKVARLDTMVTVVDAKNFMTHFRSETELCDEGLAAGADDDRTLAELLTNQIEFADVIVISKVDLVPKTQLNILYGVLARLNPRARLLPAVRGALPVQQLLNTRLFDYEQASSSAGWLQELDREHTPETDEYGISSMVYRARKPFHPERLWSFFNGPSWQGMLRTKGFMWLANQMDVCILLSQAGGVSSIEPSAPWFAALPRPQWPPEQDLRALIAKAWEEPWGDRRQELVFIGQNFAAPRLQTDLDACLLSGLEMKRGPTDWQRLEDPFELGPLTVEGLDTAS